MPRLTKNFAGGADGAGDTDDTRSGSSTLRWIDDGRLGDEARRSRTTAPRLPGARADGRIVLHAQVPQQAELLASEQERRVRRV